ncbi:MAG TPA: SMC-Scp complex subunit ScpB [Chloroflexi bacterium]|nr:SMC-Scp complex subunit ScpB [Chloroflexota bacterium]
MQDGGSNGGQAPLSLEARMEALLFVASDAVAIPDLARTLDVPLREIEAALEALQSTLAGRGIRLQLTRNQVQLTSAPEAANDVQRFLQLEETATLSRAALESLAIIAYQQPVTRPQIDAIRGVNSDSVLRTLLRHGLIEEVGRSEGPGRPILYGTTPDFLSHFGLTSLEELPPLDPDPEMPTLGNEGETPSESGGQHD